MCGIVGALSNRDVVPILIEGLHRLEYRGYDSSGLAVFTNEGKLERLRRQGKVADLESALKASPLQGHRGIAHTRWATHGAPTEYNAHPHLSGDVVLVHNGIIENHESLRQGLTQQGFEHVTETDSEVIAHAIQAKLQNGNLLAAVQETVKDLEGSFALAVMLESEEEQLVAARMGSPLVIGIGVGEYFIASDVAALIPVTQQFIILEEGDLANITPQGVVIYDSHGLKVERKITVSELKLDAVDKGPYRHYMLKEIFEQPHAIAQTLEGRLSKHQVLEAAFGPDAKSIFDSIEAVQIIACGTSYHAGMVARYWFESLAGIPCQVEVASEFRYRKVMVPANTLFVTISQSGETADTLAALNMAKEWGYRYTLAICNVPESSIVRNSDLVLMTRAGPEIGVASTKAFTTQLVALLLLVVVLGRRHSLTQELESEIVSQLHSLSGLVEKELHLNEQIQQIALSFAEKHHALFLGRGPEYPVALEGALKLKEISYIHAEAYPAGELKHGPLALVDADMPVIAVAPNNDLLEKLKSNLQEVRARGGQLFVFADKDAALHADADVSVLPVGSVDQVISPIIYTIPLQLLSYHVAVIKGTDVDQPRNLAKSVTVE
ncbi:MAG TPA: glutamine--fructose-6-phosphate transaminase (isomerizing) [Gammaproteobacteria bacterium]|nr:glutamine--fructose-6-phosphate transaminase (isomerizing) [Gammaproteobacteria bacterium]